MLMGITALPTCCGRREKSSILPLDGASQGYTAGARARSWARLEDGELTLLAYRPPPRGETNQSPPAITDNRVKGAVQANVPVVVAAKGRGGVVRCRELAIVPYEDGQIAIRRERGTRATAVSHYFGGSQVMQELVVAHGELKLPTRMVNGLMPLEWIQVTIT